MKIVLLGKGKEGQVGWELHQSLSTISELVATEQYELDFERLDRVRDWIRRHRPTARRVAMTMSGSAEHFTWWRSVKRIGMSTRGSC